MLSRQTAENVVCRRCFINHHDKIVRRSNQVNSNILLQEHSRIQSWQILELRDWNENRTSRFNYKKLNAHPQLFCWMWYWKRHRKCRFYV